MDYRRTVLPLFLLYYTGAALKITGPSTHRVMLGSDAQIPCKFTADKLPVDPKFFAVIWYYAKNSILSYDNTVMTSDPRYSINIHQALNGIADLIISNTSISDGGIYTCSVTDSPVQMEKDVTLSIQAIPAIAITNKAITKDESTLRSVISGFYPDDIDIKWFRDEEILDKVIVEKPQRDPDGTYSVRSSVTITPTKEDRERIFSCRVQHESLTTPLQENFQLVYRAPPRITITGKNIIISKENVLSCAISGFYPVEIDIKWLRDGIILNNITLEKPQRDPGGTYSVRSSVTIIPTEEDRERIFSCRIQHEALTSPLQEDFQLVYGDSTDTKSSTLYIIIPVIAGVVILIIIAAVAIFCVKRKGKKNRNKVKYRENQEEKLMPSNLQGQNKHHKDNLENQKENVLANNPPDHRPTRNIHSSSERQESCSEGSGTQQAPVYSAVCPTPVYPTSHTGLEPVTAVTQSNSHITSLQGTKDRRPTIDMQTRDSGRGQAAQQREIDHRPTGNIHPSSERQESYTVRSGTQQAPVYSAVRPAPVHPTSHTGLEPVTAATQSNSYITSPHGTKESGPSIDKQTGDSGSGQAAPQNEIDHRLTGNIHPSSERQESYTERSGTQQAPVYNAFRPPPVHHTSATKDLRQSLNMQTRASGRGQEKQQNTFGNQGGVNSAKSANKNWRRDSMGPGCQKTTSQALAVPPKPRVTSKKTEPSNQEIPEIISGTVADHRKNYEAQK